MSFCLFVILVISCNAQNGSKGYYIIKTLPLVEKGVPWERMGPLSGDNYEQMKQELHLDEKDMRHINLFD